MNPFNQLIVILERSSKYYIKKHIDKYTARIESVVKQWRKWVRQQLSVRYINGTKNTSLYPRMRSGELRKSLLARKVQVKSIDPINGGKAKAKIVIPITYVHLKDNYGEILNSSKRFSHSSFFNWKGRVYSELEKRIKGRI